jgi:glycosyltransferase involved in cell wall biosynthesis
MRVALNLEQCFQRPPGGIGRYAAELARLLPDTDGAVDGARVEVVPFVARHSQRELDAVWPDLGLATQPVVLRTPRRALYELWNRWNRADPLADTHAPALDDVDVLHAPSVAVPPRGRAPLVVTVHDAAPLLFPETYPRLGRRFHELGFAAAAARADAIVAPTAAAADEVAAHTTIARDRIRPIHHGVDHTLATDAQVEAVRLVFDLEASYVLWVGTLEPRKNVGALVDAFARAVDDADLPHVLVLAGPQGWLSESDAVAQRAATLERRVRFTGPLSPDELRALYRGADLFAFPSRHEGFGLPALEAMAQGTAVVCSDLPVLREITGGQARFVAPEDGDGWADALVTLLRDDAARTALGEAGRVHSLGFTWARSCAQHVEVYKSVAVG